MSPHKKIYITSLSYSTGDFIACEVCGTEAVDVHAIECDGMGGRPSKSTHRIENLIALCRKHHNQMGDKKQWKSYLYLTHKLTLQAKGITFDLDFIEQQAKRYA